ncbi:MAG: flagellar basal body rod C-terminal domain-containing protein [Desulfomicrobium sp.]|jgi:flagellar basal-body rod protein FlgC|nr:flagellar basal body rod C-terminal domain-containing protein [Desulfomicrobium sp.]
MNSNINALDTFGLSQQVTANNIANMHTPEFQSSRVHLETGPQDQGVHVQDVVENSASDPLVSGDEYVRDNDEVRYEERLTEGSNTDLTQEIVQMIEDEHAFAANVAALRAHMDMQGVFIDEMV